MNRQYPPVSIGVDYCLAICVGGFFDIVSLMKGHVGDGAWSGGFKAPGTS
jgi:hypothetical protein